MLARNLLLTGLFAAIAGLALLWANANVEAGWTLGLGVTLSMTGLATFLVAIGLK
jgi:hypothetical protein